MNATLGPAQKQARAYWRDFWRPSVSVSPLSGCSGRSDAWRSMRLSSGYQITRPPTQGVIAVTAVTLILSMTPLFDVAMLDTESPFGIFGRSTR